MADEPRFSFAPWTGWPWWLQMIGGAAVGIVAIFSAGAVLEPYQPFVTKGYVEREFASRLAPILAQQQKTIAEQSELNVNLNQLSVQTLNYQLLMLMPQLNRLEAAIQSGTATVNEEALAAQLREQVRQSTIIRDRAQCVVANATRARPLVCP